MPERTPFSQALFLKIKLKFKNTMKL